MKQKDSFNYTRRSRWLFLSLLALLLTLGGTTSAWADAKALPYSYGFEDYNLATDGWTTQNPSGKNSSEFVIAGAAKKTGSYGFRFSSYTDNGENTQYLISPEFNAPNGIIVSFEYSASSTSTSGEKFKVGYSTNGTDIADFTFGDEISTKSTSWQTYNNTFPAGTKYIAIYYYANYQYRLFVDDFSFSAPISGPGLAVANGETAMASGDTYNFGLATAGTEKTFTLSNPGTESITLNIAATNGFGVSPSNVTIAAKGEETLTVTMADATANGTVTITPVENVDAFTINVSGTIRDPNKVYLDFSDGQMPEGWTSEGYTSTGYYSTTYDWTPATGYIGYSYTSSEGAGKFVSPILDFANGENILFETEKYSSSTWYSPSVTVEYTTDATGATGWTAIGSAFTDDVYDSWTSRSVTIPVDGVKRIRFNGWYVKLRNIYGGEKPAGANFAIDKNNANFGAAAIGSVAVQKFIVTNSGNAAMPVTFTDATDFYVAKKIMFTKPNDWSQVNLYVWDESGNPLNGAWPGNTMTYDYTNNYGQEVWSATLPKDAANIIFSNNGSSQTADIPTTGFKQTIAYYLDGTTPTQWKNEDFSVPAKGETNGTADFYVRMDTKTAGAKSGNITLSYTAVNGTETVIPVTGTVLPAGTETVDFSSLPDGWTNEASNKWSFGDQSAYCTASTSSPAEFVSKKLDFTTNNYFVLTAASNYNDDDCFIKVLGSSDNGATWTAYSKQIKGRSTIPYGSYSDVVVDEIPASVNKLKFQGYYARIKQVAGIKYDDNDPKMAVYTNTDWEDAHKVTTASVTKDFGFATTEAPEAATYYIKNVGTGTMTLAKGEDPAGLTVTLDKTSVAAGEYATLTVAMPIADNAGYHGGDVAVTAEGLGTFTVQAQGVVVDANKQNLNFATDAIPASWTKNSWSKNDNGYAEVGYASNPVAMETSTLVAGANETIVVVAKQTSTSYYYTFGVKYKDADDANAEWADLIPAANIGTSEVMLHGSIPAAGNYLLQFNGQYTQIYRIYGLTAAAVPFMETTGADHAFGMQTAESDEYSFTITNSGTADLTGLSVTLGKTGEDAEYSVRITKDDAAFEGTTLEPNDVVTVYVKQLFDLEKLGDKSDVLTIAADGQDNVAINLTGATRNPAILYVDFDDPNAFPEGWKVGSNWYVYTYGADRYAYQSSSNTPSSLVTTPLKMEEGKTLSFKVARYSSGYGYTTTLKTRYSQNGGATWSDYTAQYGQDSEIAAGSAYTTIELNELPTGDLIFEFFGNNIKLDMIQGIKKTTAPAMALEEDKIAVVNGSTKAFENLKAEGTATYTLKNIGNDAMTSTVAVTGGATVAIAGEGEGVTINDKTVTLAAGKSATITLTVPFEAPYNDMAGAMTITTTGWVGDFTVNYTATLVDPTDFNEDFANGKPAGWYSEGWTFSNYYGNAYSYNGTNKPMITEKIEATSTKNVLSFDAKVYYGDDDQTLNVYTSTDRKNWSDAQVFNITSESSTYYLTALAEGQYYVKFEAANVAIDNVKGVKKVAVAHDLFEISNTITGTGVPGAEYTATVTAVSLIADESDIVAELWLKKGEAYTKVASLTKQSMTANTNKTFTLTGNLPNVEGEGYKMYITVKKSDDAAYFNTDEVDFTLAHNLELTINSFAVTTPAVQANDNNEYTATFNIKVTNTGSRDLTANEVSVSLINKTTDPDVVITSEWTLANSQTIFLNPSGYTSGANMAIYRWNDGDTDEQKEWALFTEISTGFYSAELNGKKNFIICRVNPATAEGDLDWDVVYNQSEDLTTVDGNIFGNNGYTGEDKLNLTPGTMATLAKNVSTTLQVTVAGTLTDGNNKDLTFYAREDLKNSILDNGYTYVTRTAAITAAPVIELDETAETYDIAANVNNRKVQVARSFNAGWNTICLPFAVSADDLKTQYGEIVALYELTSFENNNLQFTQVNTGAEPTGITAGKPYLIYVEDAITTPKTFVAATVFAAAPTDDVKGSATFKGTYTKMAASSLENKYGVSSDNRIAKGNASTTMKGFRAYLEGALAGARIAIIDETTGITRIFDADEIFGKDDKVYDLNGRRVENAKKGIYIVNGRKMVVK